VELKSILNLSIKDEMYPGWDKEMSLADLSLKIYIPKNESTLILIVIENCLASSVRNQLIRSMDVLRHKISSTNTPSSRVCGKLVIELVIL